MRKSADGDRLTHILENVLRESLSASVRLRVTVEQSRSRYDRPQTTLARKLVQDYAQAEKGRRRFEERFQWESGRSGHRLAYCDGSKCAQVTFDESSIEKPLTVEISHTFMDDMRGNKMSVPYPLRSFFVGPTPLAEALPKGERMRDGRMLDRPCDVFLFKSVGLEKRKDDLVYYLDKETSVPLKVVCYRSPELRRADQPLWAWEASTLDNVSGHYIAVDSAWSVFVANRPPAAKSPTIDWTQAIHVEECVFDRDIPPSEFWPTYPAGVAVVDTVTGKWFRVKEKTATSTAAEPIRVGEPGGIPWSVIGPSVLGACLIAAILLKLSRRRRARREEQNGNQFRAG